MINPKTGMVDWMVPDPGPPERQYPERNSMEFYIPHDMGGYYRGPSSYTAMRDPARRASWMATFGHDPTGRPTAWQHYPVWTSTWASGSPYWNKRGVATETNRVRPGLAMPDYVDGDLMELHMRFIRDLEEFTGRVYLRSLGTIKEHGEVSPAPTACPSGRMVRLYAALEAGKDDDMTPEEIKVIVREVIKNEVPDIIRQVVGDEPIEVDERLREVMISRIRLLNLATSPNAGQVEAVLATLREGGWSV